MYVLYIHVHVRHIVRHVHIYMYVVYPDFHDNGVFFTDLVPNQVPALQVPSHHLQEGIVQGLVLILPFPGIDLVSIDLIMADQVLITMTGELIHLVRTKIIKEVIGKICVGGLEESHMVILISAGNRIDRLVAGKPVISGVTIHCLRPLPIN